MAPIAPRPWDYRHYACETPSESFGDLAPIVAQWRQLANGRALPDWKDIDITVFAGWHDMMVLDAISHDPFDAMTLIWGSRLAEIAGYRARGTRWSESINDRGLLPEDFAFFEHVSREPCIGIATGQLDWRERDFVTIQRLFLPCAPEGGMVDRVVSFCTVAGPQR